MVTGRGRRGAGIGSPSCRLDQPLAAAAAFRPSARISPWPVGTAETRSPNQCPHHGPRHNRPFKIHNQPLGPATRGGLPMDRSGRTGPTLSMPTPISASVATTPSQPPDGRPAIHGQQARKRWDRADDVANDGGEPGRFHSMILTSITSTSITSTAWSGRIGAPSHGADARRPSSAAANSPRRRVIR